MDELPKTIDMTWLARIAFDQHDRPTSDWLPRGQRLVGARFNDPIRPEWMDEREWEMRDRCAVRPALRAADLRLKRVLCEGASLTPRVDVIRAE
ncbi:MAG: hypothetical protein HYS27_23140 [Deltaproteobacteria bacterium]|nr:hypothetical protein [Deltaproteobacteria bacterium]